MIKTVMAYFSYVLKSQKNKDIYIGSCENVLIRLKRYNAGKKLSQLRAIGHGICWNIRNLLPEVKLCRHEIFLKTHQQKEIIKRKY